MTPYSWLSYETHKHTVYFSILKSPNRYRNWTLNHGTLIRGCTVFWLIKCFWVYLFVSIEFPAFQEHVLENELCPLVLVLAMDDSESYVRASAIKCLCAMVRVQRFWTDCLASQHLPVSHLQFKCFSQTHCMPCCLFLPVLTTMLIADAV